MSAAFNVEQLTDAELDRLQQRLTARANQVSVDRAAAKHAAEDTSTLRPKIGDGGRTFGNDRARRNWDIECIEALKRQSVRHAVAPGCVLVARDGITHLRGGAEIRPAEHLDARDGNTELQLAQLAERGYVLTRETL